MESCDPILQIVGQLPNVQTDFSIACVLKHESGHPANRETLRHRRLIVSGCHSYVSVDPVMASKSDHPAHALLVSEYAEFRQIVEAHATRHYDMLTIIGPPGVGKSEIIRRAMHAVHGPGRWGSIRGKITPLDLYSQLYKYRLDPLVLDDLDGLLAKPDNTALLKAVCDSQPVKRVEWRSNHYFFSRGDLPQEFTSISRICLIANDWDTLNKNVAALQDRSAIVQFQPSALAVHQEIATGGWFDDPEIFEFVGRHLHLMLSPSFRFYVMAREHKRAGLDWRAVTRRTIESNMDPSLLLVATLALDPSFDSLPAPETAREQEFRKRSGLSRATYFRYKQSLQSSPGSLEMQAVAKMTLGPYKPDLQTLSQQEYRQHLENLREKLKVADAEDDFETATEDSKNPTGLAGGTLEQLEQYLKQAIQQEDFERAARLRDEIWRRQREP